MALQIASLLPVVGKIIDRIFPDKAQRDEAKLAMLVAQQEGALKEAEIQMSAIVMEAQSADPWTSRARPSFMYVMYFMIVMSVPMGILHAFDPSLAVSIGAGVKGWLAALPTEMWTLFGAGYLGYGYFRSRDKAEILKGKDSR